MSVGNPIAYQAVEPRSGGICVYWEMSPRKRSILEIDVLALLSLYALTAALLLWVVHRFVVALTRGAAVALLLLPLVFTGHAFIGDRVYGPIDHTYQFEPLKSLRPAYGIGDPHNPIVTDIYSQMFPWRRAVQLSLMERRWPLWNPWILEGHLLAGAAQPAVYSPFTLLACLLPAAKSFAFTAAIAFLIAGTTAFAFARELGCRETSALIAAIGSMYSTVMAVYVLWPLAFAWTYLPLVLLAARRVARNADLSAAALLCASLTLMIVAGHPETVLHAVILGSLYGVFEIVRTRRRPLRPIALATGAGVTSLLLCAVYLLPVVEAIPQSAEYEYKTTVWAHEARITPTRLVLADAATDLLPSLYARRWIVPDIGRLHGETSAVGSIVLALAIVAIVWRRSAETWFFAILALGCLLVAIGWNPVNVFLARLPLLDIAHNERLAFAAPFFLATLAAMGIETVVGRGIHRPAAVAMASVAALLTLGTMWMAHHVVLSPADWGRHKTAAELAGLTIVAILLWTKVPERSLVIAIAATLLVQRAISDGGALRSFPARAAYPHLTMLDAIRERPPYRIVGQGLTFVPGTNVFYGLEDARGYDAVTFAPLGATYRLWCQHQVVWFNRVDDLTRPFLSFLNIRYAITTSDQPVPAGWRKIAGESGSSLLENTQVIDRVFIPRRVTLGPQEGDSFTQNGPLLRAMSAATDFRERAWIRAPLDEDRPNGPGRVNVRRYGAGDYDIDVTMMVDGFIVISDCAWKGWRAYIDGRRVQVQRANLAFNAVYVPKGEHRVRVVYKPQSFVAGRAISVASLLCIVCLYAVRRARRVELKM